MKPRFRSFILEGCKAQSTAEAGVRSTPLRGRMSARRGQELEGTRKSLMFEANENVLRPPAGTEVPRTDQDTVPARSNRLQEIRRRMGTLGGAREPTDTGEDAHQLDRCVPSFCECPPCMLDVVECRLKPRAFVLWVYFEGNINSFSRGSLHLSLFAGRNRFRRTTAAVQQTSRSACAGLNQNPPKVLRQQDQLLPTSRRDSEAETLSCTAQHVVTLISVLLSPFVWILHSLFL